MAHKLLPISDIDTRVLRAAQEIFLRAVDGKDTICTLRYGDEQWIPYVHIAKAVGALYIAERLVAQAMETPDPREWVALATLIKTHSVAPETAAAYDALETARGVFKTLSLDLLRSCELPA